jgi:hypothetical protein
VRRSLFAIAVAFGAAGTACADDPSPAPEGAPCNAGFLGDPAKAPEIELLALRADGTDAPLGDGGDLALVTPPQGGRVSFVGVRANNVDACGVQIIAGLRDPSTKQVRVDGRTVNLQKDVDGRGRTGSPTTAGNASQIADYSNIPACPNQWASQDVDDQTFELDVVITDRGQRTVQKSITVIPRCSEPGAAGDECRCICKKGYQLGQSCGGAGAGS